MLLNIYPILLLIIAGLVNGSFVIPSKYIKNANNDQIWLCHTIIGLAILPWVMLCFITPDAFNHYTSLPSDLLLFLILGGTVFGLGQIWFAQAIQLLGIALSFAINLGVDLVLGSMFVVFYESAFFTLQGFLVTSAVVIILLSLIIYYFCSKTSLLHKDLDKDSKYRHAKGWILVTLTGITSGLQNITFIVVISNVETNLQSADSFWVWPPFLLAAAIPMFFGFMRRAKIKQPQLNQTYKNMISLKNFSLVTLMGLCFTGSLVFYSLAITQLNDFEKIIGWPAFLLSIIFATQIWGIFYKEAGITTLKNKMLRFFSLSLLVIAIVLLAIKV